MEKSKRVREESAGMREKETQSQSSRSHFSLYAQKFVFIGSELRSIGKCLK